MNSNKELVVFITKTDFEITYQLCDYPIEQEINLIYENLIDKCHENKFAALFDLGLRESKQGLSESINYLKEIATIFIKELAATAEIEQIREKVVVELREELILELVERAPYLNGSEFLNGDWLRGIWEGLNLSFGQQIKEYSGTVQAFLTQHNANITLVGRVFFHLVESKKVDLPFAFLATYSKLLEGGKTKHLPLKNALIEFSNDKQELLNILSTVNKASNNSNFILNLLETGEIFHPIGLSIKEAFNFLKEIPLYEECGILCRIPNFWKNKNNKIKISIIVGEDIDMKMNQETILDFNINLALGDDTLTIEEIQQLIASSDGLAYIKGKWVEVDAAKLQETLKAYEKAQKLLQKTDLTIVDAIRLQLNSDKIINTASETVEIEVYQGKWLQERLFTTNNLQIKALDYKQDFNAELRRYQEEGFMWLYNMKNLGLGACLADDMGLGKTIQVIAFLNYLKTQKQTINLLIVPASLIGNWMSELNKFAPMLSYYILHPSENDAYEESVDLGKYDLVITTYGMIAKIAWLKETQWDTLIIDEAQAIKNPQTKQTQMVKRLKANFRIALTGTPIENRLSDLWSLFDFLNHGLLGSLNEFKRITTNIKQSNKGYQKLKGVVSPFILRRLKTDKAVINDLPDKIEMKVYSNLSKKQIALYKALVEEIKVKLEVEEGIKRSGIILSSLIKFKQICNHPAQYLGQETFDITESGKFIRLKEICEEIQAKQERVLIFTQFREMVEPLRDYLKTIFVQDGLVLHGGTAVNKRKEIVNEFQGERYIPFMILSLKAGGVGLNLTKARHVIHFDRWWNPAIENQATDRAFRIGQKHNVIVHKFITQGTIEEKIDLLIEEKLKISNDIMPTSQEKWITEMSNDEIMKLFTFSN